MYLSVLQSIITPVQDKEVSILLLLPSYVGY